MYSNENLVCGHSNDNGEGNAVKDEFMVLSLSKWENFGDTDKIRGKLVIVGHEATELSFNWQLCLQRNNDVRGQG